jgi:hypothetical protein
VISYAFGTSLISSDSVTKYWLIIPSLGSPIMASPHMSEKSIIELATKNIKTDHSYKVSYRILKHECSLYKYPAADGANFTPNKQKLLFDLNLGEEIKTTAKFWDDGLVKKPSIIYKVSSFFWIEVNSKVGYISGMCGDSEQVFRLSPDGRDEFGNLAVLF